MQVSETYAKTVFRNDNEYGTFYKLGISKKDRNGGFVNGYLNIKFKKGVEVPNQTKIYIDKAFLDFYLDKNNKTIPYVMITEFRTVGEAIEQSKELDPYEAFGEAITTEGNSYDEMDLPF